MGNEIFKSVFEVMFDEDLILESQEDKIFENRKGVYEAEIKDRFACRM